MEFTVFLTVLISNLRDEELFHFFHVPILTENVYWKLLKYNLSMLILTQNMQIFMELRYESLICDLQCGRPVAENLTQSYFFFFFFFFFIIDRWPVVIASANGVKVYLLYCIDFKWRNFCADLFLWVQFSGYFAWI